MDLYLLQYNNYYNRTFKRLETLAEYADLSIAQIPTTNFNPNDCITTTHVVKMEDCEANYVVIGSGDEIVSRWFIIEAKRNLKSFWTLTLRRDVVADFFDQIKEAPTFIEKATIPSTDPAIYNNEDMSFNQVKKSETLLMDKTKCPWVVGYYSRTEDPNNTGYYMKHSFDDTFSYDMNIESTLDNWEYKIYQVNRFKGTPSNETFGIRINYILPAGPAYAKYYQTNAVETINTQESADYFPTETGLYINIKSSNPSPVSNETIDGLYRTNSYYAQMVEVLPTYSGTHSLKDTNTFLGFNKKVLRFSDGASGFQYYRCSIVNLGINRISENTPTGSLRNLMDTVSAKIPAINGIAKTNTYTYEVDANFYVLQLKQIFPGKYKYDISTGSYSLTDAPYGMFAIPYGYIGIKNSTAGIEVNNDKQLAFKVAMDMAKTYSGAGTLYDIQLLPYCPCPQIVQDDGTLDVKGDALLFSYILKETSGVDTKVGMILNASYSSFTLDIENIIPITNKKIQNECDMYRLVSPNFNGQFEFNAAMNDGISRFNVDCTYKPYNPYIHVNPNFKGLYGQDFNDARGLICGGDFSLPVVTSAWSTYQIQNKNYQNIFDRQIDNMKVQQKYARIQEAVGAVSGTMSGAVSGAVVGGPVGAIAGAVASAAGGAADMYINDKLRNEAIDYTKDQFGYQMGNIQALPNSLAKTTAYTYNNKIFPMIEYYTCTDEEKEALANKIRYNGMTLMRVGKIGDYIDNIWSYSGIEDRDYIKGQIIQLPNMNEDYHNAAAIAEEINKGVYFK